MVNVKANVRTRRKDKKVKGVAIANSTPFTASRQPSSAAKSAGWDRRKQAQKMMDKVMQYMNMSSKDFEKLLTDIKNNPHKHTVGDVMLYKYAMRAFAGDNFMIDWFDRNISKAPTQAEVSGKDGGPITIIGLLDELDGKTKRLNDNTIDPSYTIKND